jgi:hypothetical protein
MVAAGRTGGASRPSALGIVVLRLTVVLVLILTLVAMVVAVLLLAFAVAALIALVVSGGRAPSRQKRQRGQSDPTQRLQRVPAWRGIGVCADERVNAPVIHAVRPSERRHAAVVLPHCVCHPAASLCRASPLRALRGKSLSTS